MKRLKKTIAIILCVIMAVSSLAFADEVQLISAKTKDYEGHWAQATIQKWMDAGRVSGYPDGSYKPDANVTRAEFVKLVNGIIDFNKKAELTFKDVPTTEWYYDYVGVAQEIGYISGYSSEKFGPNDFITREQAASILARIQYLGNNEISTEKYSDNKNISAWAKGSVGAASEAGFISGYNDASFKPLKNLTRAEALTMIDNALVNGKNYVVYNEGTELNNFVVEGDLIIAKTVGDGDVHLDNVEVKGNLYVYGGGANSLYFNNLKVAKIVVDKDKVRLVLGEGTTVQEVEVAAEAVLENSDGTVAKVTVTGGNAVTLAGVFKEVAVVGNSDIVLNNAKVETLVAEKPIVIKGTGTVTTLNANANGITFEAEVKIDKTVTGTGVTDKPAPVEAPAAGGSGGGGAGGGDSEKEYKINVTGTLKIGDRTRTLDFDSFNDYKESAYLTDVLASEINYVKGELTNVNSLVYKAVADRLGTLNEEIEKVEYVKVDDVDYYNNNGISITVNWGDLTGTNNLTADQKAGLSDGDISINDLIVLLGQYDKTTIFSRVSAASDLLENADWVTIIGGSDPEDPSIIMLDAQLYKSFIDNVQADLTATTKLIDVDNTSHSYTYGNYSISIVISLKPLD